MSLRLNFSSFFIKQELERRGYGVSTFADKDLLLVEKNGKKIYTHAAKILLDSSGYLVCKDKSLSRDVLTHFHFPIPKGMVIDRNTLGELHVEPPFVIKPLKESGGKDIHLDAKTPEDVRAYFLAHPIYEEVLIEEMLEGEDVRILVVSGKFFAACKRKPAFVIGDGVHTVVQLVELENERRKHIFEQQEQLQTYLTNLEYIQFDTESINVLHANGYSEQTVPKADETIFVRRNANVSMGGIAIDVTENVGEAIREMSERLAWDLNLRTVGIDIMTKKLDKPLNVQEKSGIIEINGSPGLGLQMFVDQGQPRNPVPLLVDEIEAHFQKSE